MKENAQEAVLDAWNELESERRREILAVALLALAIASLLALFTYNPSDLAVGRSPDQPIENWIGKPGAWLAWSIIFVFGASGYALPALLLMWAIDRFRNREETASAIRKLRIAGFVLFLIVASSLMGMMTQFFNPGVTQEQLWHICGMAGYTLNRKLMELGPAGAVIVNATMLSVSLLLCTPFLFSAFFNRLAQFLFPPRPEVDEEMLEEEQDIELDDYSSHRDNGGIALKPFREGELPDWDSDPLITSHFNEWGDEDDEPDLPPLTVSERIRDGEEPKIVTVEKDPLPEADLGVNLISMPGDVEYQLPHINLLEKPEHIHPEVQREEILTKSRLLEQALGDFNITAKVVEVNYGPTITCYELEPAPGIKISRIENLVNDITRALKAETVRIVAPIPGKGTVGVEVPNLNRSDVVLRDVIASEAYQKRDSKLKIALGKTISGEPYVFDLISAPHLLVAGATGSGKSVCINAIITSILFNAAPHEVKLLMIDPKQVELALYRDIPHLLSPVVTEPKRAGAALRWAVEEMETRYRYLKKGGVRNIKEFNKKRLDQQNGVMPETETSQLLPGFLPYIVVLIDELADLMMVVRQDVEGAIARLAAMARAVGIHLVLATQRPSVDVLTGVIKNNFPSRMAFQVSSTADSRTILDMKGAESLMGRGDMLLSAGGANRPLRLQCCFVSTDEVEDVVEFVKAQQEVEYVQDEFIPLDDDAPGGVGFNGVDEEDELYNEAVQCVLENDSASTSLLQRRLKIGYGRAARLLDLMEERGIVGPPRGSKPRQIIMNSGG